MVWCLLGLLSSTPALAADDEDVAPEPLSERREVPDYDGRPDAGDEAALWVPRVLLFPLWLPTEYLLHKPLGVVVPWIEKSHAINHVVEFLTFGRSDEFFFVPIVTVDTTMRTSVGGYFAIEDFPGRRDRLSIMGTWSGERGRHLSIVDRLKLRPEGSPWADDDLLRLELEHEQRPDHPYFGLGTTQTRTRTRYFRSETAARATLVWHVGELDAVRLDGEIADNRFGSGGDVRGLPEPSIEEAHDTASIPGFDGYRIAAGTLGLDLDSRRPRPEHGSGARAEVWGRVGAGESADGEVPFTMVRYGGELTLHLDLTGHNRVVAAGVRVEQAAPIRCTVPFVEYPSLGGREYMHAFPESRFLGPSTFYVPVRYAWPIAVNTDGQLFWEMGGSYGDALQGLSADSLYGSFGFGIRARFERDGAIDATAAWGTEPFGDGFHVDVFRANVAVTRGF